MIDSIQGAIVFLGCSLLISSGMLFLVGAVVVANNIIARYWKPMNWLSFVDTRPQYTTPKVDPVEANTKTTVYKTKETTK